MHEFHIKRIYEPASSCDGVRVLVDRLWPRGISKADARIDHWAKELTPSTELRSWFHAHPDQIDEFTTSYRTELATRQAEIDQLLTRFTDTPVTLITATSDLVRGHAAILKAILEAQ